MEAVSSERRTSVDYSLGWLKEANNLYFHLDLDFYRTNY
jgi:hypothetical protein